MRVHDQMMEDIDSDLVGEFERTHWESGPETHRGVDCLDRDAFSLVDPGGSLEVGPDDLLRSLRGVRHLRDRQRGRVRREDRLRRRRVVEFPENLPLQLRVLEDRLDHEVRIATGVLEVDGPVNPSERLVRPRLGDLLLLDEFAERPAYPFEASVDVLGLEVPHPDVVTVQGRQLRDAMAHLPRPDHREFHWPSRPMMDGTELKVWCKTFMSDPPFIRPWMDSPRRFSSSERLPWRSSFRSSSSRRSSSDADTIHGVLSCAQSRGQRFWPSSWCPPRRAAFSARSGTPRTGSSSWWRCSSRSCTTTTASIRRRSLG